MRLPAQLTGIIQELMNELRQKNEEIGELRERIGRADGTIESLQRELNRHAKSAGDVTSKSLPVQYSAHI